MRSFDHNLYGIFQQTPGMWEIKLIRHIWFVKLHGKYCQSDISPLRLYLCRYLIKISILNY